VLGNEQVGLPLRLSGDHGCWRFPMGGHIRNDRSGVLEARNIAARATAAISGARTLTCRKVTCTRLSQRGVDVQGRRKGSLKRCLRPLTVVECVRRASTAESVAASTTPAIRIRAPNAHASAIFDPFSVAGSGVFWPKPLGKRDVPKSRLQGSAIGGRPSSIRSHVERPSAHCATTRGERSC
jgi:hypothetical protein